MENILKTHRIAEYLEAVARLLRALPDGEPLDMLRQLERIVSTSTERLSTQRPEKSRQTAMPFDLRGTIARIEAMTPQEVEDYLRGSNEVATVSRLRELASGMGLRVSRSQNHAALINLIVKRHEARRMDSIIRSRTVDASKDSIAEASEQLTNKTS